MARGIRPSRTQSTPALWAKSLLNAALFFALFMVAVPCLAHWLAPTPVWLPAWLRRGAGVVLCGAGVAVWVVCLDAFSRRGRGTPFPLDAPARLVTAGPFGITRNPLMTAELTVIWGEAVFFGGLGLLVYALVASVAAHVVVVRVEEPELHARFGSEYEAYCRRVPRWLPRLPRRPSP
jgi:protein-S-isoprenylcysteine O-methyltransferase Ste14